MACSSLIAPADTHAVMGSNPLLNPHTKDGFQELLQAGPRMTLQDHHRNQMCDAVGNTHTCRLSSFVP
jgi:hypothetical protein